MKKVISVILAVVMLLTITVPAFAEDYVTITDCSTTPVIVIAGDAEPIYDKNGKKLLDLSDMSNPDNSSDGGSDRNEIMKSIANVVYPFLVEGLMTDQWDNYYKNLQKEIGELLGDALLDNNGECTNGSGISQEKIDDLEYNKTHDKQQNGKYYSGSYRFWYDWRLDPVEVADEFNEYIKAVKEITHKDKVAIVGKCLGTNVVMAYVAKYGLDDIKGIALDGGVSNGAEALSEAISGKFVLDGNAVTRFMLDCDAFGLDIDEFLTYTIDLLTKGQVFNTISDVTKATIYDKVLTGVTSALALSTVYTWPSYWAGVTSEDYETAKNYVFGEEGSEKRTEYAGLIEKLDNYDVTVRQHVSDIVTEIGDNPDVNLIIISKYGMQMLPIIESRNCIGDQFASVTRSSFGATTSSIYDTLSDDYIKSVTDAGNGRYIAPDKQVDASTCMYPDYTWFVKGASHTNWTHYENYLLLTGATYDRQITVNDTELSQFMVYSNEAKQMSKMTTENCDCYNWTASEKYDAPTSKMDMLIAFITSLIRWFRQLFVKLSSLIK